MNFFASGNDAVDQLGQLNISGNVTPQIWYQVILTDKGKPNYLAIVLLSEIVYWYRPTEVRDERSGNVLGWKKRFKGDMLQRSYEEYAEKYGESKKTIQRALCLLEEMNIIKRVFRNVKLASEYTLYNVMYIDLNVERLKEVTFPEESILSDSVCPELQSDMSKGMDKSDQKVWTNLEGGMDKSDQGVWTNLSRGMDSNQTGVWTDMSIGADTSVHTNTSNTSKKTIRITSENTTNDTYGEYNQSIQAGPQYVMDEIDSYIAIIKENICYNQVMQNRDMGIDKEMYDEMFQIICDVVCVPRETIRVGGENYPYQLVKKRFLSLNQHHLEYAIECVENATTDISNIRAYMITTLYNAPTTKHTFFTQLVNKEQFS